MLGKIIDGRLVIAGKKIKIENGWITNPTEEKLKELGYKEIEYTEKPTFDKEEMKLYETYTEYQDKIIVAYATIELSAEEHNAIIQAEIVAEENKITARNVRNAIMGDNFAKDKITEVENNIAELRTKIREITNEE